MPLIKDSQIIEDPWTSLDDETPLPAGAWPIVSLERWQDERESLKEAGVPLGLRLRSDQSPRQVAEDLAHFAVIALEFPKFTDGRAYSSARLLRERYGYKGELRAVGHVLRDQALFLVRCGFDAFEVAAETSPEAWRAALARISVLYQGAADGRPTASRLRWRQVQEAKARIPAPISQGHPQSHPQGHPQGPSRGLKAEEPCAALCAY